MNTTGRTAEDSTRVRRLFPEPGPTTIVAELERYLPGEEAPAERPWTAANMVTSLDGRAAVDGGSTGLGSPADREYFLGLRTRFEAVMVGAGTIRAERYGRVIRNPRIRAAREEVGLPGDPLAVIVSGRLDLPWDAPIFTDGGGRVLIFTRREAEAKPETATPVRIETMPDGVEPARMLEHLRQEEGVHSVLCEGGPHLLGQLTDSDLLDELFLTVSPLVAGSEAPRIAEHNRIARGFEPHRALLGEGDLLLRYRRSR